MLSLMLLRRLMTLIDEIKARAWSRLELQVAGSFGIQWCNAVAPPFLQNRMSVLVIKLSMSCVVAMPKSKLLKMRGR